MSLALPGRRALVTGATGGIGRAIARELHRRGAIVVATGRRAGELDRLRSELGERCEPVPADLAAAGGVEELLAGADRVDVLVANAALPGSGPLTGYSAGELDRALDVNLRAPMQLSRALLPGMVERGAGHLVFISSLSGKLITPGASVYSATKFALRAFALCLREDLHGTPVGVSTVFPGFVSEAGLWADTGIELPRFVALRSPAAVGRAVAEAVERDRAEVDVAPLPLRAAGRLAGLAPRAVAAAGRRLGAADVAARAAEAQRPKR